MDSIERLQAELAHKILPGAKSLADATVLLNLFNEVDRLKEIERLRGSQFRWRLVEDGWPGSKGGREMGPNGCLVMEDSGLVYLDAHYVPSPKIKYWAHVPPLPEKSQADRDDEMLRVWIKSLGAEHTDRENSLRIGYLEGLKAARSKDVDKP